MKKIAAFIVRRRIVLGVLFIAAATASAFMIKNVRVNYDLTKYLADDCPTSVALAEMKKQFGEFGSCAVMIKNVNADEADRLCDVISEIDGVGVAFFDGNDPDYYKDGNALVKIILTKDNYARETQETVNAVRNALSGYDAFVNGEAVFSMAVQQSIADEMPIILIIAFVIIFFVLVLTSRAWIEPLIFFATIAVAILINMGTNAFLGQISFITQSICAILQLALAMDYSIVLLHRFGEEKALLKSDRDDEKAMATALVGSFASVSGSALTTVAGLFALCLMSFKIGLDIGIVLIKGILVTYLTVFAFMPCIILFLSSAIDKTAHKSLIPKMSFIVSFAFKSKKVMPIAAVVLIGLSFFAQQGLTFSYTVETTRNKNSDIYKQTAQMSELFGAQNEFVVMIKKDDGEFSLKKEKTVAEICREVCAEANERSIKKVTALSESDLYLPLTAENLAVVTGGDITQPILSAAIKFAKTASGKSEYIADALLPFINGFTGDNINMLVDSAVSAYKEATGKNEVDLVGTKINKEFLIALGLNEKNAEFVLACLGLEPNGETTFTKAVVRLDSLEALGIDRSEAAAVFDAFVPKRTVDALGLADFYGAYVNDPETSARLATALNVGRVGAAIKNAGKLYFLTDGKDYTRLIASGIYPKADERSFETVRILREKLDAELGVDEYYLLGESVNLYDIKKAFDVDYNVISVVSSLSVLMIIMLTFRSILLPALLVLIIQGAIWINTAASAIFGERIFFIAYLILISIQMGATIDYGIVLSDRYCCNRRLYGRKQSLARAADSSASAIITSGAILTVAGAVIGLYSTVPVISVIGLLLARGTLCSLLLIAFFLPPLLLFSDKLIAKTTYKSNFTDKDAEDNGK